MHDTAVVIEADYFDGMQARAQPVRLRVADGFLCMEGSVTKRLPLREVQWAERTRHGVRITVLPGGASLQCGRGGEWDAWVRASGVGESAVVRAQQSWRAVCVAMLAALALGAVAYACGMPWVARAVAERMPPSVERQLGERVAAALVKERWFSPTALSEQKQESIRHAFEVIAQCDGCDPASSLQLRFHKSHIGPNALALPGGVVIVTDELVELLDSREDAIQAVLAHELGHVRLRHGLRTVAQSTLLAGGIGLVFGDFSSLMAAAPAMLGQLAYSREFEREADAYALELIRAHRLSAQSMVFALQRLQRSEHDDTQPAALSTHPATAERIHFFEEAAQRTGSPR